MDHRATILSLLADGHRIASQVADENNPRQAEALAREANGYFSAAAVLLNAFSSLHNEMIDLPEFVAARKFLRQYPG